ncbi:methyltransferase domain-containing protein [Scytonema sp. UIC 10036]|uniref:class I SAM-dependent methyltransferase n=1 Tax=Scytonema sp. UIC 10036 TaxID=2304196 RepID=UPI0012DA3747|nr:class I SAM-dependent methyltransferase [Scytonema sp. UIC 10036]MUG98652.1 methyltransferase domain-containing protein [Scytonema sp. UIC 10036]
MICYCCGSTSFKEQNVLWKELIDEWRIGHHEVEYINRQQGMHCTECNSNLRSIALSVALMRCFGYKGLFKDFVTESKIQDLQILEINEAGSLTQFLTKIPGHHLKIYPEIDMMNINYVDESFDLIVHSDVLEHIKHPVRGLSECYRVLKPGGYCAFTVPMIVDRLTLFREGLPPSYHGSGENLVDFLVYAEYGCDAWKHIMQSGFQECRIFSIEYPSAQALVAVK